MGKDELHVNDLGKTLRFTIIDGADPKDLSSTTSTTIFFSFRRPGDGGTVSTQTSSAFVTDGSDGQVDFTIGSSALFDTHGTWKVQAIVESNGNKFYSEIKVQEVFKNL